MTGSVIGHGGCFDNDIRAIHILEHCIGHLFRCLHLDGVDVNGIFKIRRSGDQYHLGTSIFSFPSDGIAHFPGGWVADKAHGIDGFVGGTGRYQDPLFGQIIRGQVGNKPVKDIRGVGKPAGTGGTAGKVSFTGREHMEAVGFQYSEITLNRRAQVHIGIHRRADNYRGCHCGNKGTQRIVCDAIGDLSDDIGRRRGYNHCIGFLGPLDVFDIRLITAPEKTGAHRFSAKGCKGQRTDKFSGAFGHHHPHL